MRHPARVLPGAILIALGLVLLAANLFPFDLPGRLWPVVLLALGLLWIIRGPLWLGAVSMTAGAIFLAESFETGVEMTSWWPLLIVAVGVGVLLPRRRARRRNTGDPHSASSQVLIDDTDTISVSATFSGAQAIVTSQAFRGGTVSATFGSAEVNMRSAQLHEDGADLELSATFGSVTLRVPQSWVLQQNGSVALSGVENVRSSHPTEGPALRLRVSTSLGSVTIED